MANPSLAMIPSGYKDGTLYSPVPNTSVGDFDVSRGSLATRVNNNGLIETVGYTVGGKMMNSFDDIPGWSLSGTASISGSSLTITGNGSSNYGASTPPNTFSSTLGKTYKVTYTVVSNTLTGNTNVQTGGISGAEAFPISNLPSKVGINEEYLVCDRTSAVSTFSFSMGGGTTGGSIVIKDFSIKEFAGEDVPRIDYTDGGCPVLLTEPQSTNEIAYSEDFSNAYWSKTGSGSGLSPIVTPNQSVSPNGNITSDKIVFPIVGSGFSVITRPITVTNNHYSQSIYLKGELGNETIWLMNTKDGVNYYEIECNLSTQWQRFNYSALLTSGSDNIQFGIDTRSSTQSSNTIQTIYAWGAQLEELPYASSYIPTSGGTATRLGEAVNGAGDASTFNDSEGVLFAEVSALSDGDTRFRYISLNDGTPSNIVKLVFYLGEVFAETVLNGVNQGVTQYTFPNAESNNKVALKYKLNDFALWVNGVEVAVDSSGSIFPANTLNELTFTNGGGNPFYGKTSQVQVFNTALTDAELTILTTI